MEPHTFGNDIDQKKVVTYVCLLYVNTASKKELTARFLSLGVQGTFCMERSVVFVCSGGIAVFVKKVLG